jgi:hypothetical protein
LRNTQGSVNAGKVRKDFDDTIASEWPELKSALMDLVSNVIMHPENGTEWFIGWCREHQATVRAAALIA